MADKKLKILFVTKYVAGCLPEDFTYHGEWTDTYELILALREISPSTEIYLLTPMVREMHVERFNKEFGINLKEKNIRHIFANVYLDFGFSPEVFRWQLFKKEREIVQKFNIEIIQYGQIGLNYSYFFKNLLGIKKIICYGCFDDKASWPGKKEDDDYKKERYAGTFALNKFRRIGFLLLSKFLKIEAFDKRVNTFVLMHPLGYKLLKEKCPKLNIKYIPKGQSRPFETFSKRSGRVRSVLFIGFLQYGKGIIDILKVAKDFPDLIFNIVGSGNIYIEDEIKSYSKKYENIKFIGAVGYCQKWKTYLENDIFILPSYKDTFPSVILEALSCALPVITTYEIDSPIEDGENGFLFHAGSVCELREKLKYLINNSADYSRLSRNALRFAGKYTWENAAKKLLNIYLEK